MKTSLLKLFFYSVVFFSSLSSYAASYYWVGGTGSWTDLTHWATTSGGSTKHTVLPTSTDDVFFDANSFTVASQVVTVTDGATFRTMDWTGAVNSPTITCSLFADVNVYGGLILPASVLRDFTGNLHFKATSGNYNVNLGNLPLRSPNNETLYFEGAGGTWTLTGGITIDAISLTGGTLNTNGQPVTCSVFGTTGSTPQTINLGNSNINVSTWNITSTNITVNAGTSSITSTFSFNGKNLTYNNLTISGNVSVGGNNTFNTITLNSASTLSLTAGTTQTISSLVSNGTVSNLAAIKSTVNGTQATLSKSTGTVSVNYVSIRDNNATGGATFNAPTGSVDLGNVTGWNITPSTPSVQTTSASVSKALTTSMELRWTNGNGASRIVLAKATSAVNSNPVDNSAAYVAGAFGAGTQIGTGNYIVYMGNADRATITGLTAGTTYHFAVFEFNGSGATAKYLTPTTARDDADALPSTAVIISNSPVTVCSGQYYDTGGNGLYNYSNNENFTQTLTPATPGNKLRLTFNDFFTSNSADVLSIYDGADTNAPLLGSFTGGATPGIITATNAAGKLTIKFVSDALFSSTGWDATISCITLDDQPTIAASAISFSQVTGSGMKLTWTPGNGKKRIVIAKAGSAVNFTPADATDYTSNSSFGSGTNLSTGNFVVYNGNGNTVDVTNLSSATTYHFSIYEYSGANTSANYRTSGTIANQATTSVAAEPTISTSAASIVSRGESSLGLSWTNGNGVRRVVVMKQGSAVNAVPVDGILYTSTQNFSTGTDLGNGNKVVYSGTSGGPIIAGLSPLTTYYFAVYEFNGTTAGVTNYLTTNPAIASGGTLSSPPTVRPAFAATYANFNSIDVNWTNGNAEKVILIARTAPASFNLTGGVEYTGNTVFGQGQLIAANTYVVYAGSGTGVTMTGLIPSTKYDLFLYGYNGSGTTVNYALQGSNTSITTLKMKPTVQASNVTITNVSADSMKINWQRGDGEMSMVVVKAGSPVSATIRDSTKVNAYVGLFGQGYDFGNGNVLVYKGNESSTIVRGLDPSTTYHVAVYELNDTYISQTNTDYNYFLTTNAPTASATTLGGRKFYWVNGKGKWADFTHHWATASGGATFQNSVPRSSDDVYFDENSFATDKDSVIIEGTIYFKNMDWTKITKPVFFGSKSNCLGGAYVYGSIRFSNLMSFRIGSVGLWGSGKNVLDLGNKQNLSPCASLGLWAYGGEWTVSGPLTVSSLTLSSGTLITNSALTIQNYIDVYNTAPKKLELGNAAVVTGYIRGGTDESNLIINGGRFSFNNTQDYVIEAGGAHFKKLSLTTSLYNKVKISGTMSVDSLLISPGREVQFQSGKTYTIGQLIVNGDSTKTTILSSSIPGSAARFSKSSGEINISYVILKDNEAIGGAKFNALNSVNAGNVTGWNISIPALYLPKRSTSNIQFKRVFRTNMDMQWTNGDGVGRIVVVRQDGPVNNNPVNNTIYTGSTVFGSGADLGNGNFVVYSGSSTNAISLTGLTPGKDYHFAIFEYNAWDGKVKYKTTVPAIANVATVGTSDIVFANNTSVTACGVKFFDEGGNGFYTRDQDMVQTISPSTPGTKLGMLFTYFEMPVFDSLVVYDGPSVSSPVIGRFKSTSSKPTQLVATNPSGSLTIRLRGSNSSETDNAFKGWVAELFCVGNLAPEPSAQTVSLKVDTKNSNSITLKASKGNGSGRLIIGHEQTAVNRFPADGSSFVANQTFGSGFHLGENNYLLYSGSDETVTISGLKQNTTYHFAAIEFNGSLGTTNYLLANPALAKDTTEFTTPTIASTNLAFTNTSRFSTTAALTPGNGTGRILVARKNKEVSFVPKDGMTYTANSVFGAITANVGDSTFVVANASNIGSVLGLEQLSTYYFKVFEFNGDGKRTKYLTASVATGNITTTGPVITMKKIEALYCQNTIITVPFEISSSFNTNNKYTLQLSAEDGTFTNPVNLKDTVITSFVGNIKARIPNTIKGSTTYKLRIISSSPKAVSDSIRTTSIPNVPDITLTQDGSTLISSVTSNIQWLRNGEVIAGATGPTQNFTETGSYSVKVSEGGCSKTSSSVVITGLEDVNSTLKIYPNPIQDQFEIEVTEPGSSYVIYDIQGKELLRGILTQRRSKISSKEWAPGIFLIKITTGQSSSIRKVIKN